MLEALLATVSVLGIPSLFASRPMRTRPVGFTIISREVFASGVSLPSLLLQITKLPFLLLCPEELKRMKSAKLLPLKVYDALSAGKDLISTSPVSNSPSSSASVKTSQPFSQLAAAQAVLPELVDDLSSTLRTVTERPSFTASLRAKFRAVTSRLAEVVKRLLIMVDLKLGIARPVRIPAIATVTISSTRVKPLDNRTSDVCIVV